MRYILLLRGVNVGGKNKVSISELKNMLLTSGFEDIDSYINSGNLFFTSYLNQESCASKVRQVLDNNYNFNIPFALITKEEYLEDKDEYNNANMEQKSILELPYLYSDLTLNEMINLSKKFIQGDKIKLVEPPDGLKDKYVASAMGNYFIQDLESNLTKREKDIGDVRRLVRVRPPVIKSKGIIGRNN